MITIRTLDRTCGSCPSQWEGMTDDGRYVYVRYRWGHLRIGFGDTILDAVRDEDSIHIDIGDNLDGYLSYRELISATSDSIRWPLAREGQHL